MTEYKVIEFGTYVAGPLLGRHLKDVGMKVVCIRRPLLCRV